MLFCKYINVYRNKQIRIKFVYRDKQILFALN